MALSQEERNTLRVVQLLFGKSTQETKEYFESLGIYATLQYAENKTITIPFIGTFAVSFKGDKITTRGKEAQVDFEFTPSPFLVRVIGQVEDEAETDAEKILITRFRNALQIKEQT